MAKSVKVFLALILIVGVLAAPVSAGLRVITGKVLGSDGGTVVGATVLVRGNNKEVMDGAPTGLDGRFVLKISTTRAETISLEVSSIGYAKYEREFYLNLESLTVVVKIKAMNVDVGGV